MYFFRVFLKKVCLGFGIVNYCIYLCNRRLEIFYVVWEYSDGQPSNGKNLIQFGNISSSY